MKRQQTYNLNNELGFTLLEVMIAMFIFAIGLLGLAGLQATALQNEHSSYSRNQAVLLAYEIADRMKANPDSGANYVIAHGAVVPGYTNCTADSSCVCTTNECSASQLASYDLGTWKTSLAALLPSGDGTVTASGGVHTITVRWDEDRSGATGTNCPVTAVTDLRCFQLSVRL